MSQSSNLNCCNYLAIETRLLLIELLTVIAATIKTIFDWRPMNEVDSADPESTSLYERVWVIT